MMKIKVLILIFLVLAIVAFAGNKILGNRAATKLDETIQLNVRNGQIPFTIYYDKIEVNPLFSEITFYNLVLADKKGEVKLNSEELQVNMKYNEAMKIAKTNSIKEVTCFELTFDNVKILNEKEMNILESKSVQLGYKGGLVELTAVALKEQFPQSRQEASFKFNEVIFHPENFGNSKMQALPVNYNVINEMNLIVAFDPDKHKISLYDFSIDTDHMGMLSTADFKYAGTCKEDFSLRQIAFNSESASKGSMEWENPAQGKFYLKNFEQKIKGKIELNESGNISQDELPEFDIHMVMDELKMEYKEEIKQMINTQGAMVGINADDISIEKFEINSTLKDGKLIVNNTELQMPVFNINLEADVELPEPDLEKSQINVLSLRISNILPKLQSSLINIETMIGFKIPMDGEDILFTAKGNLKHPQIKGIHY